MTEPGGRPEWVESVLLSQVGQPRHRADDPRGSSWFALEASGHVLEAVILLGAGLTIGFLLGGLMLGCGR